MLKQIALKSPSKLIISALAALSLLAFGSNTSVTLGPTSAFALDSDQPSKPKKPASKDKKKKTKKKKKKNFGSDQSSLWGIEENKDTAYLTPARAAIAAGDYQKAIVQLAALKRPDDANVLNLLGYSHRKLGLVDVGISYYLRALENNPQHTGVHEYLGEAYVQKNDIDKARVLLKKLSKICGTDCQEYKELAATISEYEAKQQL
ncbi:MAG: tetratricopeptide repeat protein [Hyphomicrobiales bacterium]